MAARTQTSNNLDVAVASATASTIQATGLGSWPGYHIAIVSSTVGAAGQMRYAYTSAGRTDVLKVTPEWDTVPAVNDDLSVAKNQANYDSDYGNDFKLLLKATSEWDVGATTHTIGSGTDHMVGGVYNQGFSQDTYIDIQNGSYFAMGALFGGESLGGWYWDSNNATTTLGYQYIRVQASGTIMLHNLNCGTVYAHSFIFKTSSFAYLYDVSFTNLMYDGARLKGNTYGNNLKFQGNGVSNDYVVLSSAIATFDGPLILSNSYGIYASAANQTIRVNKYVSVNNAQDVEANHSTTWQFVNPSWTNPSILWTQTGGQSTVSEIFTLDGTTQTPGGIALASSKVQLVYTSGTRYVNATSLTADASGGFSVDVRKRYWANSTSSVTYNGHILRTWKYGYVAFEGALSFNSELFVTAGMAVNSELTTSTQASALLYNATTTEEYTIDRGVWRVQVSIIATTPVSAVVSATSGATNYRGTLREINQAGDGLTSEWFLVVTSATTTGHPPSTTVAWLQAGATVAFNVAGSDHEFTYMIDAKGEELWKAYDKDQASHANTAYTGLWNVIRRRGVSLIDKKGDSYTTEDYQSQGVFITNRGAGTVEYMTANDGWTYTPPQSYTLTLTGLKTDTEVRIYNAADDSLLAGTESSGTSFNYNYTYSGSDITAYIVIFHLSYKEVRLSGITLSNSNQSIPIQQQTDRVYLNP